MKTLSIRLTSLLAALVALTGCSRIDDDRIPQTNVNIVFTTEGMWNTYGVNAPLESRRFIKLATDRVPADFPYTLSTYTGYGGILLVGDLYNNPLAYDLSCPFEARPDVRISVDSEALNAYCDKCGSVYDIFSGYGRPIGGPAAERGYGLTRYRVVEGIGLNYRIITR